MHSWHETIKLKIWTLFWKRKHLCFVLHEGKKWLVQCHLKSCIHFFVQSTGVGFSVEVLCLKLWCLVKSLFWKLKKKNQFLEPEISSTLYFIEMTKINNFANRWKIVSSLDENQREHTHETVFWRTKNKYNYCQTLVLMKEKTCLKQTGKWKKSYCYFSK